MLQLLSAGYTNEDFEAMCVILSHGIEAVCDNVCESCVFDRACADVMRVTTHINRRLNAEEIKD